MAEVKGEKRVRNMVHDDAIWRQTIQYELLTANSWEKDWGFMKELYDKSPRTLSQKPPLPSIHQTPTATTTTTETHHSGLPSLLPPGLTPDPNSTLSDWLLMHDVKRIIASKTPNQKYGFPCTTMQEVGWDWEDGGKGDKKEGGGGVRRIGGLRTLERYGRYAEGRRDVLKWWGGARESLP
ncbi:hypothetical protein HDV00_007077 [Rhizophlyctis rosea]|nr:hypothetical protein HDV00_007077 [Rhizophlyctis rosea]